MIRLAAATMATNTSESTDERGGVLVSTAAWPRATAIGQAAYAASEGGVVGITLPIARHLALNGIRNMMIAPDILGTPMLCDVSKDVQDALDAGVPFPRPVGTPETYAKLVKRIVENDLLDGEVIRLDGTIRLALT